MNEKWTKLNMTEQAYSEMVERDRIFIIERDQKLKTETERIQKIIDSKEGPDCTNTEYFDDDYSIRLRGRSIFDCMESDYFNKGWDDDFIYSICKESQQHQKLILEGLKNTFCDYIDDFTETINKLSNVSYDNKIININESLEIIQNELDKLKNSGIDIGNLEKEVYELSVPED